MTITPDGELNHIKAILQEALTPHHLDVIDTSAKHKGHAGYKDGQMTHIRIIAGGGGLAGLNRLTAHRRIYEALAALPKRDILHAIEIKLV